jgi:hypothetical protein
MNLADLKKIWNSKQQILEGFKNSIVKDEFVESIATLRNEICQSCLFYDTKGDGCMVPGTQPCCSDCGCSLHMKQRSLSSSCGQGKWDAITEEDEEN